jgi:P-type Ca2+ transporter type 2C
MKYYQLTEKEVLEHYNSSEKGLTASQAKERLAKYGRNELENKKESKIFRLIWQQINNIVVYILLAAFVVSLITNQYLDASVILAIVVINTILGFIQEFKAEKSIEALKKLSTPYTIVMRDNHMITIPSVDVVPGDIIFIETGSKIPADCYLLESFNLKCDESSLTGESIPVKKEVCVINRDITINEQKNIVFTSTTAVHGRGKGIVVGTGMGTEIGKIAYLVQESEERETPLQHKLNRLGKYLGSFTLYVTIIIFLTGLFRGHRWEEMLIVSISLAVAAIPEGLPAVVTVCLSLGVQRMISKNVLIKRLSSVETLGSTSLICSDKTGTITCNEMTVEQIYSNDSLIEVTGRGYSTQGSFLIHHQPYDALKIKKLLETGFLCNDSKVNPDSSIIGDPTEAALIVVAEKANIITKATRVKETPFSSELKFMATIDMIGAKKYTHMKGAPEIILKKCAYISINGKRKKLTTIEKNKILKVNEDMGKRALRVLGFAYSEGDRNNNLTFLGLMGMIDPPRKDVKSSLELCKKAGIRVIMITGDHKITAQAIAKEIGLGTSVLTGDEIDKLNDVELKGKVLEIDVFARVTPEHKVKILNALAERQVVAMTGDGVNDAPALKQADIGVAVGSSTDVSKEASDMIITDNKFSSIVKAVEEGRGIFDNIKKFINYLLSSNLGEVLILFVAMMIGFKDSNGNVALPLIASQILWINLVTDGLPALALGADPVSKNVMDRPPRKLKENIISANMALNILFIGILMTAAVLFLFKTFLEVNLILAQTVAFTTLVMLEMVRIHMVRSKYRVGFFSNKWLLVAILSSVLLQLMVIYTPFFNRVFNTVPLGLSQWVYILVSCLFVFIVGSLVNSLVTKITKQYD